MKKHGVPDYVVVGLNVLGQVIKLFSLGENPCENNSSEFSNSTFSMRAFYWGDDSKTVQIPNFKYKDFEVSWYKYLGRGMEQSREISEEEFRTIFKECLNSLVGKK